MIGFYRSKTTLILIMINSKIIFSLSLLYLSFTAQNGFAGLSEKYHNPSETAAVLFCNKDLSGFVVEFGHINFDDRKFYKTGLDKAKTLDLAKNNKCTLKDGTEIIVNYELGVFSQGQGGGDPDNFFFLKIGSKNIYSHKIFYAGYSVEKYLLSSISYDGQKLKECDSGKSVKDESGIYSTPDLSTIKCRDISNKLSGQ